jgi:hypothetical protein
MIRAALSLAIFFVAGAAIACQCGRLPSVAEAVSRSSFVVQATAVDVDSKAVEVGVGVEPWTVDHVVLGVTQSWKGSPKQIIRFNSGASSCDYRFKKGEEYVVFLEQKDASVRASQCMPTTTVENGAAVISQLGSATPVKGLTIWQRIRQFFDRVF